MNPRYESPRIHDFESRAFSLSATHPICKLIINTLANRLSGALLRAKALSRLIGSSCSPSSSSPIFAFATIPASLPLIQYVNFIINTLANRLSGALLRAKALSRLIGSSCSPSSSSPIFAFATIPASLPLIQYVNFIINTLANRLSGALLRAKALSRLIGSSCSQCQSAYLLKNFF